MDRKGYGMVVQTTARDDIELIQIGYELEKRFGMAIDLMQNMFV